MGPGAACLISGMEKLKARLEHGHKELDRVEKRRQRPELGELSSMRDQTLVLGGGSSTTTREELPPYARPLDRGRSTVVQDNRDDFFRPLPSWEEEEPDSTRYEDKDDMFNRTDAIKSARILELERKLHELIDAV